MKGRYERVGQRVALILFLSLASVFVVSTVAQYTTMVFWPKPPVPPGACREALIHLYAQYSDAARQSSRTPPERVEETFLDVTKAIPSLPSVCAGEARAAEAAEALVWLRVHVGERIGSAARTDLTIRNELMKSYIGDSSR